MNKASKNSDVSDSSSVTSDKRFDGAIVHGKRTHESDHNPTSFKEGTLTNVQRKAQKRAKRRQRAEEDENAVTFPQLLMEVLENDSLNSIISWLPHGLAFAILDKRKFARDVMGRYLKQSKFTSFTRKLNRWGFERVAKGQETGAYYHPLFQRSNLQLCLRMMCQKSRDQPKDGSVASGAGEADGSTTSSKPSNEDTRRAPSQKITSPGTGERASQVSSQARQVEARNDGVASAVSSNQELLQLERVRQMLQMQLSASQGAIDGQTHAASAQRFIDASAGAAAAHEARLQHHQQQQQQLQMEDFRQRLEQAQADQSTSSSAGWAGLAGGLAALGLPNNEAGMRHLQMLQQQRQHLISQGAAEAALRSHAQGTYGYALSEGDLSALQLHQLSSMIPRHDQGQRAQLEQLQEARQRLMWRQQMELAAAQQAQMWGVQSMAQQQPSQGNTQENAQRQLHESIAAQNYLQQQQSQAQQQQQQQPQQQLDPLTLQLIQQAMNGQFDPSAATRGRFQS